MPLPACDSRAILARLTHPVTKDSALFTAQQLFGEFEHGTNVLTFGAFLDRACLERAREHDDSARLALGAYVVCRLVGSMFTLDHSSDGDEAFAWQLDAVRRHLRALPVGAPELAHLTGISHEVSGTRTPSAGLRLSLMAYAYFLEHEGRLEEALEVLGLATRTYGDAVTAPDFASIALFAARLNRLLARWNIATSCYTAAEEAAKEADDRMMQLRARLGCGAVLRGTGNLPMARAIGEEVMRAAADANLPEMQAMAYTDLGAVYSIEGRKAEYVQANYRAFVLTEDPLQRMRILGDIALGLTELGILDVARLAFEIVVASNASFVVRTNAMLELMAMEAATGDRMAFQRRRGEVEGLVERMPPSMLADFHYKAGVALARFGQLGRARALLKAGMTHSESHRLNAWYFRFDRTLTELSEGGPREPELATDADWNSSPALQEVAVGLREYASSAS
jgi:tetratricopeptide (TPR) repeat protein